MKKEKKIVSIFMIDQTHDKNKYWATGVLHRENGPAIEYEDGEKGWYMNGVLHRENGPAVEYPDGQTEFWVTRVLLFSSPIDPFL